MKHDKPPTPEQWRYLTLVFGTFLIASILVGLLIENKPIKVAAILAILVLAMIGIWRTPDDKA